MPVYPKTSTIPMPTVPQDPPEGYRRLDCRIALQGSIEGFEAVNILWYRVMYKVLAYPDDTAACNATCVLIRDNIWTKLKAAASEAYSLVSIECRYIGPFTGYHFSTLALSTIAVNEQGTTPGPSLPSYAAVELVSRYFAINGRMRTTKSYFAGIGEGTTDGSLISPIAYVPWADLVGVLCIPLTTPAPDLNLYAYPVVLAKIDFLPPNQTGKRGQQGLDRYITFRLSTMRRRKIGRGS